MTSLKGLSVLSFTGMYGNYQGYIDTMADEITSGYRCADIAGKKSSQMVIGSRRVITENKHLGSTFSPCRDLHVKNTALITVCTVDPVPSIAWKPNGKEKGTCFESLESHENEIQPSTQKSTYESQGEESGHKLDSESVETDEYFGKDLCLMTSENYGQENACSEAGELIVASNLT